VSNTARVAQLVKKPPSSDAQTRFKLPNRVIDPGVNDARVPGGRALPRAILALENDRLAAYLCKRSRDCTADHAGAGYRRLR
jgi:hypothetical protein